MGLHIDAYAFAPDGSYVTLPGTCVPVMNTLLGRSKDQDYPIHVHDVTDRDGRPMRVIYTTLNGHVLYSFQF